MRTRSLVIACLLSLPALASADPRVVLSTDPLGPIHDSYALSATYALGTHAALRADARIAEGPDSIDLAGHHYAAGGVSVQLFLDRTYHGPFIEPGLLVQRTPMYADLGDGLAAVEDDFHIMPELLVGWQWLYHDRYSLAVAIGGARAPAPPYALGGPSYFSESYLRVGYAF